MKNAATTPTKPVRAHRYDISVTNERNKRLSNAEIGLPKKLEHVMAWTIDGAPPEVTDLSMGLTPFAEYVTILPNALRFTRLMPETPYGVAQCRDVVVVFH